jgi:hypothetical protein
MQLLFVVVVQIKSWSRTSPCLGDDLSHNNHFRSGYSFCIPIITIPPPSRNIATIQLSDSVTPFREGDEENSCKPISLHHPPQHAPIILRLTSSGCNQATHSSFHPCDRDMAFFNRVINFFPGRKSANTESSNSATTTNHEKSASDDTDETKQGTDPDIEQQQKEEEEAETQADNLDRRRNVRTLPRECSFKDEQTRKTLIL